MGKKYIGLTIGPIVSTLSNAKQTGELWACSYIFSYTMKNIIKKLLKRDRYSDIKDRFILPDIKEIDETKMEVGLYHDRMIFESKEDDFAKLSKSIDEVIEDILKLVKGCIKRKVDDSEIKENIQDFFKIYFLEIELGEEENVILKVNGALDALELREKIKNSRFINQNYLLEIFRNNDLKQDHFLIKDAFKEGFDIPCLYKIALGKAYDKEFKNNDEEIEKSLEDKNKKKSDEYVAIVQADGDGIGKIIENLKNDNNYKDLKLFSKKLLEYAHECHKIIKDYTGFTIYAGGDDLLFIAPLKSKTHEGKILSIFDLIDKLTEKFEEKFEEYNKNLKPKATTSFGVAIVHHKYPLYYSLDEARNLLFHDAKKFKYNENEKNAIAFKVIKNSGQLFKGIFNKESKAYEKLKELYSSVNSGVIDRYLKSIHFKLINDKTILEEICSEKQLLKNYFRNNFNEDIHKTQCDEFLEKLVEFIYEVAKEDKSDVIDIVATSLRFIKFMDEEGGKYV